VVVRRTLGNHCDSVIANSEWIIEVTPAIVPAWQIYAGDTQTMTLTFKTSAGVAINLVTQGYTQWASMWRPSRDSESYLELTVDSTAANVGQIIITADAEVTRAIDCPGVFDLQATDSFGVVRTFITGPVEWVEDVTR
jgi:hypothetical protein